MAEDRSNPPYAKWSTQTERDSGQEEERQEEGLRAAEASLRSHELCDEVSTV